MWIKISGCDWTCAASTESAVFARVLRSKGTCWIESQHRVVVAWSHVGKRFWLTPAGVWWVILPATIERACLADDGVDTAAETDAFRTETACFEEPWGDRRQELVFIGVGLDEAVIERALDGCLATEEKMQMYAAAWSVDEERIRAENGEVEPFRFAEGEQVECRMGDDTWEAGTVLKHFHRATERWTPYQVALADRQLISAPADMDACIRRAN